jgi:hypothetical protein
VFRRDDRPPDRVDQGQIVRGGLDEFTAGSDPTIDSVPLAVK